MLEKARGVADEDVAQAAEPEPEAEPDVDPEAEAAEPEPELEAERDAEPEPASDTETEAEPEAESEAEPEREPAPESESETAAEAEPEAEAEPGREPEAEPEDEIPPEYRVPATAARRNVEPWRPGPVGIAIRAVSYTAALCWPFVGTLFVYEALNDGGAVSNVCSSDGCLLLGSEFASRALPWLFPIAAGSVLVVRGVGKAVGSAHERKRVRAFEDEPEERPVPRIVLAGLFAGICTLAFVVGVLRGVMIDLGH